MLLLAAKNYGSENHSQYFMVVPKNLIPLLINGIQESLKALLYQISKFYLNINSLQLISFKQTGFNDNRLSRDM